ncbi:MAG TPA: PH domain-containing protein, partial [Mycobacterium sp.]|nr:PH domain-containing protein [Mycobacterium sp.]
RGWFRTQLLQHADIKIIRITEFRRHGRNVRLLEVETVNGGLVLFSRWDLGTNPLEVLDALTATGYAGRKPC